MPGSAAVGRKRPTLRPAPDRRGRGPLLPALAPLLRVGAGAFRGPLATSLRGAVSRRALPMGRTSTSISKGSKRRSPAHRRVPVRGPRAARRWTCSPRIPRRDAQRARRHARPPGAHRARRRRATRRRRRVLRRRGTGVWGRRLQCRRGCREVGPGRRARVFPREMAPRDPSMIAQPRTMTRGARRMTRGARRMTRGARRMTRRARRMTRRARRMTGPASTMNDRVGRTPSGPAR
jgi:hypothetical protein